MPQPFWIEPMDVMVVGPSESVGKAIVDAQPRHGRLLPAPVRRCQPRRRQDQLGVHLPTPGLGGRRGLPPSP
jgi:hypothetical protein